LHISLSNENKKINHLLDELDILLTLLYANIHKQFEKQNFGKNIKL